ncbi:MAG: hypothetical protein ACRC68_15905 [Clostridium sp.]
MKQDVGINLKKDKRIIKAAKGNAKAFEQQLILNELYRGTMPLYISNIEFIDNNTIILSQSIERSGTYINRKVEVVWDFEIGGVKIKYLK